MRAEGPAGMSLLEQLSLFGLGPAAPRPPTAARARSLMLSGQPIEWQLERSRRKTVGMIVRDGRIHVRAPRWVSLEEIERILQSKSNWLTARLREGQQRQLQDLEAAAQWGHEGEIQFLGQSVRLMVQPEARSLTWLANERQLILPLPSQASADQIKDLVQAWLQSQAREILLERLEMLAAQSGRGFTKFSISHARTRWGSCTAAGHIRLNWRLVQFSLPIIDYVVAHELAHLRAMDHSPGFWSEVAKILPNYEEGKRQMKGLAIHD